MTKIPKFAASVHNAIFDEALGDIVPPNGISAIKAQSTYMDANIATYDPMDHIDNGYVDESWQRINERLDAFRKDPTSWKTFGAAAHTIGDFYAHTSYMHFAPIQADGTAAIYQPGMDLGFVPDYSETSSFSLVNGTFSVNTNLWDDTQDVALVYWNGKLISGRYAQKYDPCAEFWDGLTSIPYSLSLGDDFKFRGALPHHNEIAVDSDIMIPEHKLYSKDSQGPDDRMSYANQFQWRKATAIKHIRQTFQTL